MNCYLSQVINNAVNNVNLTNSIAGNYPIISSVGQDPNIDIQIDGKGSGRVILSELTYPKDDNNLSNQALITNEMEY